MRRAARPASTARRRCAACGNTRRTSHNGSAPTLEAVVEIYNSKKGLGLMPGEVADLAQYLKSL